MEQEKYIKAAYSTVENDNTKLFVNQQPSLKTIYTIYNNKTTFLDGSPNRHINQYQPNKRYRKNSETTEYPLNSPGIYMYNNSKDSRLTPGNISKPHYLSSDTSAIAAIDKNETSEFYNQKARNKVDPTITKNVISSMASGLYTNSGPSTSEDFNNMPAKQYPSDQHYNMFYSNVNSIRSHNSINRDDLLNPSETVKHKVYESTDNVFNNIIRRGSSYKSNNAPETYTTYNGASHTQHPSNEVNNVNILQYKLPNITKYTPEKQTIYNQNNRSQSTFKNDSKDIMNYNYYKNQNQVLKERLVRSPSRITDHRTRCSSSHPKKNTHSSVRNLVRSQNKRNSSGANLLIDLSTEPVLSTRETLTGRQNKGRSQVYGNSADRRCTTYTSVYNDIPIFDISSGSNNLYNRLSSNKKTASPLIIPKKYNDNNIGGADNTPVPYIPFAEQLNSINVEHCGSRSLEQSNTKSNISNDIYNQPRNIIQCNNSDVYYSVVHNLQQSNIQQSDKEFSKSYLPYNNLERTSTISSNRDIYPTTEVSQLPIITQKNSTSSPAVNKYSIYDKDTSKKYFVEEITSINGLSSWNTSCKTPVLKKTKQESCLYQSYLSPIEKSLDDKIYDNESSVNVLSTPDAYNVINEVRNSTQIQYIERFQSKKPSTNSHNDKMINLISPNSNQSQNEKRKNEISLLEDIAVRSYNNNSPRSTSQNRRTHFSSMQTEMNDTNAKRHDTLNSQFTEPVTTLSAYISDEILKNSFGMPVSKIFSTNQINIRNKVYGGTMGEVYLGLLKNHKVAVKKLKPGKNTSIEQFTYDFQREVGILSQLHHPNIIELEGVIVQFPLYALVLELVRSQNLFQVLVVQESPLSAIQRMSIALQAVSTICYLHNARPIILHRDIKSENFLYDPNGFIKLCDFAKSRLMKPKYVEHYIVLEYFFSEPVCIYDDNGGSIRYMAPEAFPIDSFIDETVDVWAKRYTPEVPENFVARIANVLRKAFEYYPEDRCSASTFCLCLNKIYNSKTC